MTQNIEQLIDRYFDGQLSVTEQTELFRAVDTDSVARQLFDAEQFIRGSFTADAALVRHRTLYRQVPCARSSTR